MTIFVDLKKLFSMPAAYSLSDAYVLVKEQIESIGSMPPRYTVGFKSTIITEPYIKMYNGPIIRLADTPENHEGIKILATAFRYDDVLAEAHNRRADATPITPEEEEEIQVAQEYVSMFYQNYGPMIYEPVDDQPQQLSVKKRKAKWSTKRGPS